MMGEKDHRCLAIDRSRLVSMQLKSFKYHDSLLMPQQMILGALLHEVNSRNQARDACMPVQFLGCARSI